MIGLFDKIKFPDSHGTLVWVDAPVEYSPWVEYTGMLTYDNFLSTRYGTSSNNNKVFYDHFQ